MIQISGVHIEHPETDGIVIEDGRLISATGCRIDKPETGGIRMDAAAVAGALLLEDCPRCGAPLDVRVPG